MVGTGGAKSGRSFFSCFAAVHMVVANDGNSLTIAMMTPPEQAQSSDQKCEIRLGQQAALDELRRTAVKRD